MSVTVTNIRGGFLSCPLILMSGSHCGTRGDGEIMVVMEVPRTRHQAAHGEPWPDAYAESGDEDPLAVLEEFFWKLDRGPGQRVELLEGRIVVSPPPVYWHSEVALWLYEQFRDAAKANGWGQSLASDLVLPPTRDIAEPDHLIIADPGKLSNLTSKIPVDQVLLVSEIVSLSSIRDDREVKRVRYAKAGIPFCLLVDRFSRPVRVTLFSKPAQDDYAKSEAVTVEEAQATLRIPAPCEVALDVASLPLTRAE